MIVCHYCATVYVEPSSGKCACPACGAPPNLAGPYRHQLPYHKWQANVSIVNPGITYGTILPFESTLSFNYGKWIALDIGSTSE